MSEQMIDEEDLKRLEAEERRAARAVYLNCDHVFEDVTDERRSFLENSELPSWAKALIEKEDRKWINRSEKWRTLTYLKCDRCGLLRVVDE